MTKPGSEKKLRLMYERDTRVVAHPKGGKGPVDTTFNEDSKIHSMLEKFARGEIHPRQPFYADVSEFSDFRKAQERVLYLTAEFNKLPSQIRALAENDPANIGRVFSDPRNRSLLHEFGVFEPKAKNDVAPLVGATTAPQEPTQIPKGSKTPKESTSSET